MPPSVPPPHLESCLSLSLSSSSSTYYKTFHTNSKSFQLRVKTSLTTICVFILKYVGETKSFDVVEFIAKYQRLTEVLGDMPNISAATMRAEIK